MMMRRIFSRRTFLVALLPLTVLGVAFLLAAYDLKSGKDAWQREFERVARERTEAIRLAHFIALAKVTTVKGFFDASDEVTESEFFTFGSSLNHPIQSFYRALSWAPRVLDSEREVFEARLRESHPDFAIWEVGADGRKKLASKRHEYFPVTYLWYDEGDERVKGWDVGSSEVRRVAMDEAVTTGKPVMTDPLQLSPGQDRKAPLLWGYLVVSPVYTRGPQPTTADERRQRLSGLVVAPFHYGTIVENQLRSMPRAEQSILVFASSTPEARPVHEHLPENLGKVLPVRSDAPTYRQAVAAPYSRKDVLAPAGKALVLVFTPLRVPSWWEWAGRLTAGAILGGGLLTLLSMWYVARWIKADEHLRESRERLALTVKASGQGLYDLDIPSGTAVVTPEYATMLGYDPATYHATIPSWLEQMHPDDREPTQKVFEEIAAGKRSDYSIEYRIRTLSGQWKWILSIGRVVQRDAAGRPLRMVGTHLDIADRKHAEELERERMRQMTALLNNMPDMAWLKDREYRYIAVNEAFAHAAGRAPEELVGKSDLDIWPVDLAMAYRRIDEEIMQSGGRRLVEEQLIDSAGKEHWMETIRTPIKDGEGRFLCTAGISRDITERRRTEQTLRENAHFLESLDRISRILAQRSEEIDIRDELARAILEILRADRVFFLYPCTVDAPSHQILAEAHRPQYASEFTAGTELPFRKESLQIIEKLLRGSSPVAFDFSAMKEVPEEVRRYGVQSLLATALYPQRDKPWALGLHQCSHNRKWTANEKYLLQVIAERISDAFSGYLLLKQLKESEERYREAQRTAQLGHWSYDVEAARFGWWSEESFRLVGLDPTLPLPSWEDFMTRVHLEDQKPLNDALSHSIATGEPVTLDYRIPLLGGATRYLEVRSVAHRGAEHRVMRLSGTVMDVTEHRRREAELQQKTDELIRFNYTVSHDLKSPLVTIRTFLGYLEQDMLNQDHERIAKDMGFIRSASEKMVKLIDELIEFSRIGKVTNVPKDVSLQDLVQEAQIIVAGRLTERGVTVHVTSTPILIHGDRPRLVEVFQNLLDNAVKFTGDEPSPTVEVGAEETAEGLVVYVRDNGMGIDPRHQHKLFGLFEKLDAGAEGTGIGLALVKRIIEVHGGRIWVESPGLGRGATFRFILPGVRCAAPPGGSIDAGRLGQ
jgi:PAS domain S-box-containing protein